MIYLLAYVITSALYGFIPFMGHPQRDNIPVISQFMFGTTFPLHLITTILALIYRLFGVNIFYMVTLDLEKDKENGSI